MSFFSGFKNYILELIDENHESSEVIRWGSVAARFETLLLHFDRYNARTPHSGPGQTPSKGTEAIHRMAEILEELLPTVGTRRLLYGNDLALFHHIRLVLLSIWRNLLRIIKEHFYDNVMESPKQQEQPKQRLDEKPRCPPLRLNDVSIILRFINALMIRSEFSLDHLKLDRTGQPHCSDDDLNVAQRYRVLLINTQSLAQEIGGYHMKNDETVPRIFINFIVRVFAVNCFRLPRVPPMIASQVKLSEDRHAEVKSILADRSERIHHEPVAHVDEEGDKNSPNVELHDFGHYGDDEEDGDGKHVDQMPAEEHELLDHRMKSTSLEGQEPSLTKPMTNPWQSQSKGASLQDYETMTKRRRLMKRHYPDLFRWHEFHDAVLTFKYDSENDKVKPGSWLRLFTSEDRSIFFRFLHEWVQHILTFQEKEHPVDWTTLDGYRVFESAFVYSMKQCSVVSGELRDCSCSILLTNSSLFNFYMHSLFEKTNVYHLTGTLNAICTIETWLRYLIDQGVPLPPRFEASYLAKAVDIILQTDHHQLLARVLSMLYSVFEIFTGEARVIITIDLLLHKYFFPLFLHWDQTVRTYYMQLLLFRGTRMKRSQLDHVQNSYTSEPTINEMSDQETIIDIVILGKVETYWRMLSDQVERVSTQKDFPLHLEAYSARAMNEYYAYGRFYAYWETLNNPPPVRPIPYETLANDFKK